MVRRTQVYVGDYIPPHPSHIELLMQKFIEWLNSPENRELHPIRFAALAHYKLVYIHPFVDGNGRTSRLLMNLILMQSGYPPVIIRKQDRLKYYQGPYSIKTFWLEKSCFGLRWSYTQDRVTESNKDSEPFLCVETQAKYSLPNRVPVPRDRQ